MNIVVTSFNLDISLSSFCVFDPLHFSHLFYVFEKPNTDWYIMDWSLPFISSIKLHQESFPIECVVVVFFLEW